MSDPGAAACPHPATLAAYLEAALSEVETAQVEAHLSACPDCLETAIEMRELLAEAATAGFVAPAAAARRAKALVAGGERDEAVYQSALRHWLLPDWKQWGQRAAAAAAGLALCISGYQFGMGPTPTATGDEVFLAEASFGLYGSAEGVDDALLPVELEVQTP